MNAEQKKQMELKLNDTRSPEYRMFSPNQAEVPSGKPQLGPSPVAGDEFFRALSRRDDYSGAGSSDISDAD